jgi:hypothetical protein
MPQHSTPGRRVSVGRRSPLGSRRRDAQTCDETFLPYRHLAIRVLDRALQDMAGCGGTAMDRESARAFLAGSGMLRHWCRVAAVDPCWLTAHVFTVMPPGWNAGDTDRGDEDGRSSRGRRQT